MHKSKARPLGRKFVCGISLLALWALAACAPTAEDALHSEMVGEASIEPITSVQTEAVCAQTVSWLAASIF